MVQTLEQLTLILYALISHLQPGAKYPNMAFSETLSGFPLQK